MGEELKLKDEGEVIGYCCVGGVTEKIISNTFKKVWNKNV